MENVLHHPILMGIFMILEFWLLYLLLHGLKYKDTIGSVEGEEDEFTGEVYQTNIGD
jgi:hypothetical protein